MEHYSTLKLRMFRLIETALGVAIPPHRVIGEAIEKAVHESGLGSVEFRQDLQSLRMDLHVVTSEEGISRCVQGFLNKWAPEEQVLVGGELDLGDPGEPHDPVEMGNFRKALAASSNQKPGMKYDSQKLNYALVDGRSIAWLAGILTYGAVKYTRQIDSPCEATGKLAQYCTCGKTTSQPSAIQNAGTPQRGSASSATPQPIQRHNAPPVTPTGSPTQGGYVAPATTHISDPPDLNTQRRSEQTRNSGTRSTQSESETGHTPTTASRELQENLGQAVEDARWQPTGSHHLTRSSSSSSRDGFVQSASEKQREPSISTTITKQESREGCSAESATRGSASWESVQKIWSEHSPTCEARQLFVFQNGKLCYQGQNNWRKVEDWRERYYAALMRHVELWRAGERDDPETGMHHLAGALFSVMCLLAMDSTESISEIAAKTQEAIRRWKSLPRP